MEEKSKGFSLRQKKSSRRPPISAPKQITSAATSKQLALQGRTNGGSEASSGNFAPGNPQKGARERPRLGGGTSDLVKRRYSTRFTNPPDFSAAQSAPPIPTVPSQHALQVASTHKINIDLDALKEDGLDVEKYTTTILSDASNQELRNYQASLRKIKNRTSTDLQENVYQNRTQFIKVSKEADKLKGEMRVLRSLMSELTSSLNQSLIASSIPEARTSHEDLAMRARKHTNRSSVANLEALWNVQLQALWKNVEGSQKFLPAIPGRHVVHESGNWVELDAATWKARRPAHIFLLNDHLLIATKKKRRVDPGLLMNGNETQGSGSRLIADKCWPLENIEMVDITPSVVKDRSEMSNAISIRNGPESFTYRFEKTSNSEKANVLLAFRRTADELRKSIRADVDGLNSKIMGDAHHFHTQDSTSTNKVDWSQSMKNSMDRLETFIEVDGKHQNLRWVEGQIDELDSEVALQMFEDAVLHVEKLRRLARGLKGNASAQELILMKVDDRATKISDLVTHRLVETHSFLKATQTNVAWLIRLGFDDNARDAFLRARSDVIAKRNRQILFEGNLHHHIFQISFVYFTLIRNTVSIYQQCFPPLRMSACVKWAKEHLDNFNRILASQLSNVQRDSPTWEECMDRAREHAKWVDEVGLDFKHLVGVDLEDEISDISSAANDQ